MRIITTMKNKEPTYQVILDALALSPLYPAFLITAEVLEIYMQQFWHTITKIKDSSSYQFKLDKKKYRVVVEVFHDILQICLRLQNQEFVEPPYSDEEIMPFWKNHRTTLGSLHVLDRQQKHSATRKENMPCPRFTKAITQYFIIKDKSISVRNILFMHTVQHDNILGSLKYVSKTDDYQAYGALILAEMTNLTMWNFPTYKTFLAYATGVITPKKARKLRNLLLHLRRKVLLLLKSLLRNLMLKHSQLVFKSETLLVLDKKAIKRSKQETNIHQAGGSSKGVGLEPEVPDEPKGKSIDTSEGTGLKPRVPDVYKVDSSKSESDNPRTSDDEEETQEDEFVHTPEKYVPTDDETNDVDDEEYRKINEEMYDDVNVELKDVELANEGKSNQVQNEAQVTTIAAPAQVACSSRSISSNYGSIFLNLDNISSVETGIISMLDVRVQHENLNIHSSSLLTVPVFVIPEPTILSSIPKTLTTSTATTTSPPIHPFIPHPQQLIPIPTPITIEATTSNPAVQESETLSTIHLRVSDLEKEVKELKNVDHSYVLLVIIKSEVLTAVKEYLGTSLDDALHKKPQKSTEDIRKIKMEHAAKQQESQYTITSSDKAALKYFEMNLDEDAMDKGVADKLKKRNPDDVARDGDPPTGLDKGLKRRKTSKDTEQSKKVKSTDTSKGTTKSQPKCTDKSTQLEETMFKSIDTQLPQNLGDDMGKTVDDGPTQNWLSDLVKSEKPSKTFNELMSTPINFTAFAINRLQISHLIKTDLVGPVNNLLKGTCKSYVELKYNMEEYMVPKLWSPIKVAYDKHAALERNRLMCSHKLYKFSDGTLISVHDKLKDMVNNLEMGYTSVMPRRKWSNLDKKLSRIMVKYIDHQLLERRLMRSLEKFVGGREYGEYLRQIQWTI
ncbi:hypothetical protein Tco_1047442 [Tanacetum coccineum]